MAWASGLSPPPTLTNRCPFPTKLTSHHLSKIQKESPPSIGLNMFSRNFRAVSARAPVNDRDRDRVLLSETYL